MLTSEQAISRLDFLPPAEKRQLLIDWNATAAALPETCIHQRIEAQAELTPDAPAVIFEDEILTYRELNVRANRLARSLIALGVGPDVPVAILLERSHDLIVALLATLKAGGAYVPLDPEYPAARLAFMLEDSGARILITQSALRQRLPQTAIDTLCLDTGQAAIAQYGEGNPHSAAGPRHLAYIIYTSGSTGTPKGVAVEHRGVLNLLLWMQDEFMLAAGDRVLQKAPASFDVSVWEFFWPLMVGAQSVLARPGGHRDNAYLVSLVERAAITTLHFVPPMLESFLDEAGLDDSCRTVRRVFCGGQALSASLERRFFDRLPHSTLYHMYGPTEATVDAAWYACAAGGRHASVPIGRPLANTRLYVLDRQNQPVPIGVPGELHIGGAGVARGYWHRPELTAERFISDPFSSVSGDRLYKTGDLVRYRSDGNLEFLGRLDHQVKIRGFRIELGEIEMALANHPAIRQAAVMARGEAGSDQRLVAYVVPVAAQPAPGELRAFLKASLPDYMLPAAWVFLSAMPLTPNGKVDRTALDEPEVPEPAPASDRPRDAVEEILAGIWATVLHQTTPGIHDNFFELGGHSLLAIQVVARVRDALGIAVPVRWFFEAPTVAELAGRIRPIVAAQAGIEDPVESRAHTIPRVPRDRPLPLSFSQKRLWLLDQVEGPSPTYNMPGVTELSGSLDVDALNSAFSEIVRRHEALRTCLAIEEGVPVQLIAPARPFRLPVIDLRNSADPAAEADCLARQEAIAPFDLAREWPLRAQLLRRQDSAWTLLCTLHHSAADGWSSSILSRELNALYAAFRDGQPSPLPELPIQYADFALWQRAYLSEERLEQHIDYWRKRLAGIPDCLNLPTDRPRPSRQTHRGSSVTCSVDPVLTSGLKALSRRSGATLFMTLLAAWATLMGRHSGEDDIVIGSPVANRTESAIEPLIGCFVNTVALRADLKGNPSFLELLARLRSTCLEAYAHQELPFESLVEALGNQARGRLFRVLFVLQNMARDPFVLPDLDVVFPDVEGAVAKFDLSLSVTEFDGALDARIEYATDLFDRATIERLRGHFLELLHSIVAHPEQSIHELELLPAGEKRQLLTDWNATVEPMAGACVPQRFEEQAEATPDAPAVIFEDEVVTYGELNARANQLAHALIGLGVSHDQPVAIALGRSPAMIVALLATLKAGGAYVPLDPDYPAGRVAFMLEDSGARVLITSEALVERLPGGVDHTLCLDRDLAAIARHPDSNPDTTVARRHLAYIIYTSGSTGQPKGVAVNHGALLNFLLTMRQAPGLSRDDVLLSVTTVCFDIFGLEIYLPLLNGGAMVLAKTGDSADPALLSTLLARHDVTMMQATPATWRMLIDAGWSGKEGLKMLVGGEALSGSLAREMLLRGSSLWNLYGPTETTIWSSILRVRVEDTGSAVVSIGRPIANTQLYVLDRCNQPVPIGVPGELHIGGVGLARGYWHRPELTAAKFIPDSFGSDCGARLFKTGDLVRYQPDGNLEFLGRLDHQIKIRGFRVELGEIEAALATHPAIRRAVVVARNEAGGDQRLVAYVVPSGAPPGVKELRAFLKTSLPDYMLPAAWVFLPALPLTSNGKLDRGALPDPPISPPEPGDLASPTEVRLAAIWSELLVSPTLERNSDFLASGGHSLLVSQLVSRIRNEFQVEFSIRQIFDSPVLKDQARLIEQASHRAESAGLQPVDHNTPLPLSFPQEGLWLQQQMEPNSTAYNVPLVLRLEGVLDESALVRSLQATVERHEILRTRFVAVEGKPFQIVEARLELNVPVIDMTKLAGQDRDAEIARRIHANSACVFDLTALPLLRAELLRISADEHLLLTSMHHIICDGWSIGILVDEWKALYSLFTGQAAAEPAPLKIQYADYAVWQRHRAESGVLAGRQSYWVNQLAGASGFIHLPVDFPRPPVQSMRGAACRFEVERAIADLLESLSGTSSTTLFMTVLAAFGLLLARYTGEDRVVVASAAGNRNREELEPLIGYFVHTLPLSVDVSGDPTFIDLLARVREMSLGAYAHQEVSSAAILELLNVTREPGYTPFGQVGFALHGFPSPPLEVPGLRIDVVEGEVTTAKAELTLTLSDRGSGLAGRIDYNADLFEPDTMRAVAADFVRLAGAIGAHPEKRCSELLELGEVGPMPLASLPENRSNLTRSQLLAWIGQKLRPDDPLYNLGFSVNLPFAIDPEAFRQSIDTLIQSSDALRMVFREVDGVPRQTVLPEIPFTIEMVDLSEAGSEGAVREWTQARLSRPFALDERCFDTALIKLGPEWWVWYSGAHHLIMDGFAFAIIIRQVSDFYEQAISGTLPREVPLASYQDYINQERRSRSSRRYRAAESYWKAQLERPTEPIPFYGRIARYDSQRIESILCQLGEERSERLRDLAGRLSKAKPDRRALFEVFGAFLSALLYRISGATEIALGLGFHNRTRATTATIGHFMTVVPLRFTLAPDRESVETLASRFGSAAFKAFRHTACAIGNPHNRRIYEVFYNYQVATYPSFNGKPVTGTRVLTNREEDTFALHITDYGESGNIGVQMDFNCTDFTVDQRQRTLDLFLRLIDTCLDNPQVPIDSVDLMNAAERSELAVPVRHVEFPLAPGIHSLFEDHVRRNPTAEALVDGERSVSYAELNRFAERLAARLEQRGVTPETRVAILLERGVAQIVALLAVLKAGGVYVPIDADLPANRIRYILEDSGARILVTSSELGGSVRSLAIAVVSIDADDQSSAAYRTPALAPDNAAYVIYTSGSTGKPKGVVVTHRSLINAFHAWKNAYGLATVARRHLQMASFSFDVFTGDWIRALCSGGALILCPRDWLLEPENLARLIRSKRIDCAEFVPAVSRNLTSHLKGTGGDLSSLKVCIVGSDTWTAGEYRELRALCGPATRLVNSYGLTEATIDSSFYESDTCGDLSCDSGVPIGRPFANTGLHILDCQLRPVPPGVPGELFVGGEGVARGYLGKPALTAERFIPDPFSNSPGARLYTTGDRARLLPSGDVEFLGRVDRQVKVRGLRIELAEIEAALMGHPEVRQAAVVVDRDGADARIAVWIEPVSQAIDTDQLRAFLSQSLPEYMVPSLFVPLVRMPLTPSGKVDRRALPPLAADAAGTQYTAPRNDVEARLVAIWTEVLRLPKIGVYDSFFAAGGQSLIAAQIISRTNKEFGVRLPLRTLFEDPTISGQASRIAALKLAVETVAAPSAGAAAVRLEGEV